MSAQPKTAFVLAGGGSLGAIQVGMLAELTKAQIIPDMVVGSSVGALNAAFFAGDPSEAGVARLSEIWRGLKRTDIFPVTFANAVNWLKDSGGLFDASSLRRLIERSLPFQRLEEAALPLHVVATNLGGMATCLSKGPAVEAILASAAIPVAFPAVRIDDEHLIDGAIGGNTPILTAVELGATRVVVLPTGFACALSEPPKGAVGAGLHALTLLVAHQMVRDLRQVIGSVEVFTLPSLCPLDVSPFNFSQAASLIERAADSTRRWLDAGGLSQHTIPEMLSPHHH